MALTRTSVTRLACLLQSARAIRRLSIASNQLAVSIDAERPDCVRLQGGDIKSDAGLVHSIWLRDIAPCNTNATSGQQELLASQLDPDNSANWAETVDYNADTNELLLTYSGSDDVVSVPLPYVLQYGRGQLTNSPSSHNSAVLFRPSVQTQDGTPVTDVRNSPHGWQPGWQPEFVSAEAVLSGSTAALEAVLRDDLVIVTDMPCADLRSSDPAQHALRDAMAVIMAKFGQPRRTFYSDRLWDTAPKAAGEVNDTAYTNLALPLHTDCTYMTDPPGLQLFSCAARSSQGGASTFLHAGNAFAALQDTPEMAGLQHAIRPYQARELGVRYRASGSVFHGDQHGPLAMMRFNLTDRDILLPSYTLSDIMEYYRQVHTVAFATLDLQHGSCKDQVCRVELEAGQMAVVNNHRVMHGRDAFQGHRNLVGCYVDMDEFYSVCRVALPENKRPASL